MSRSKSIRISDTKQLVVKQVVVKRSFGCTYIRLRVLLRVHLRVRVRVRVRAHLPVNVGRVCWSWSVGIRVPCN